MAAAHSPVLQPTRAASRGRIVLSPMLYAQPEERLTDLDLQDDLGSLNLTQEPASYDVDSDVSSGDEDDSNAEPEEGFSMPGVAHSNVSFSARRYATPGFATAVLDLLQKDLQVSGWATLPPHVDGSHLAIHKVSGALTNAVFFVSAPELGPDSPPTVLVRVYGPSSGSLISRKTELHVLHTLSANYGIGPAILGTFGNGRVEQYFRSRALHKEEMRLPRISKWIARRMRELHTVPADQMRLPGTSTSSSVEPSQHSSPANAPTMLRRNPSSCSLLSQSSQSSAFSFSSAFSNGSSVASSRSTSFIAPSSAASGPDKAGFSESLAPKKRRSYSLAVNDQLAPASASGVRPPLRPRTHERLGVWDNITRWTQEAARVLKAVEKLRPLVERRHRQRKSSDGGKDGSVAAAAAGNPLHSPEALLGFKDAFDLPSFERKIKGYRSFVSKWEKTNGKSKRVLSHNDTQYGNLLIRLAGDTKPETPAEQVAIEPQLVHPHEMIIVVDFEYASLNARGYDIANHFIEWQADYHHEQQSHSLSRHLGPPRTSERRNFYRAYLGIDNGSDRPFTADQPVDERDDQRALRLEAEVALWEAASHASWAQWAIVQSRDAILGKVDDWLNNNSQQEDSPPTATTPTEERHNPMELHRTRSGEIRDGEGMLQMDADDKVGEEADFDYLQYALERIMMFRESCRRNGVA